MYSLRVFSAQKRALLSNLFGRKGWNFEFYFCGDIFIEKDKKIRSLKREKRCNQTRFSLLNKSISGVSGDDVNTWPERELVFEFSSEFLWDCLPLIAVY